MKLFLDFDGVLHAEHVYMVQGKPTLQEGFGTLFQHAYALTSVVADFPSVEIVLSTSWVPVLGFSDAKACLPQGLQERGIGATWQSKFIEDGITKEVWLHNPRFRQIMHYVQRNVGATEQWLAIDDDIDGWADQFRERLIACDGEKGLGGKGKLDELRYGWSNLGGWRPHDPKR
jgi:hypothetical protein